MLASLVIVDIALVAWSLNLMQSAIQRQEFSLMLAGVLVALSAMATVVVYSLAIGYYHHFESVAAISG
jgi:hypothetical protein